MKIKPIEWETIFTNNMTDKGLMSFIICVIYKYINSSHNWTTQRDGMGREEGGGFRMGNTCISVADSF